MTPQELKNSILQLAIQGKLVGQRPEEGTAEELFARIQEEKRRLIKEGKIKKEKPLPEITEDEKSFEIPESWKWTRLGEISSLITKGTTPRGGNVSYLEDGIGFLRAENVAGLDKLDKTNLKYIDENTHVGYLKRSILQENDILITIAGTLGRTAIARKEDLPLNANQAVSIVRLVNSHSIELLYLIYALNSGGIQKYLTEQKKTTAIPNLTLEIIENCILPLPPLAEQKRIVAKIEELLPYIDRYEQAWSKLEQFNSRFPEDMKKSLLQYAIQGKLVEQRPEEGTAEELFARIQEEKQRLIKAGKIKKEKPLPEITDDEKPFEIPESWKWVSVGSVSINIQYGSSQKSATSGKVAVLRMGNIQDGKLIFDKLVYTSDEAEIEKYPLKYNDLLFNRTNSKELVGKTAIYKGEIPAIYAGYLVRITPLYMNSDYLNYVMQSQFYWNYCQSVRSDAIGQSNINAEKLKRFMFPLPPFAEQKRIVEKLEQLLPLCERLK